MPAGPRWPWTSRPPFHTTPALLVCLPFLNLPALSLFLPPRHASVASQLGSLTSSLRSALLSRQQSLLPGLPARPRVSRHPCMLRLHVSLSEVCVLVNGLSLSKGDPLGQVAQDFPSFSSKVTCPGKLTESSDCALFTSICSATHIYLLSK